MEDAFEPKEVRNVYQVIENENKSQSMAQAATIKIEQ